MDAARDFPDIRFGGRLRSTQARAMEAIAAQWRAGRKRLHVVAPPGSGKTVMGLYLWAQHVRRPALVLSPNSAIQAQWARRLELFDLAGQPPDRVASTDPDAPAWITSLTYQSVTLPRRGEVDLDERARDVWRQRLIEEGHAENPDEATAWIDDLAAHNPDYFQQRLSVYRKQAREALAADTNTLRTLHERSLQTLHRLRDRGVGLVILDECHHLLGHWGRVLDDARELLDEPVILGLTATPPDRRGRDPEDLDRYDRFFGPIDFEVPTPALVKEGHLAPYQDLAYFVRPGERELAFIARADRELRELIEALEAPRSPAADDAPRLEPLTDWVRNTLIGRRLPTGPVQRWADFERRDPAFADAGRLHLRSAGGPWPQAVPEPPADLLAEARPQMAVLVPVIDRYVRHGLRRSPARADHALAERAIARLRVLGVQITETGPRPCASPVGRVMAHARAKTDALIDILRAERNALGDRIRAMVVTDFELSSATHAEIDGVLDAEAGGAVAAFRTLLRDAETDALDPVLVTGSTVLVDDDLFETFLAEARAWLGARGFDIELVDEPAEGFHRLEGRGADWCPRHYVAMVTDLFQRGVTRCLVGTRGLLGEGWDAHRVNVLVDLTNVTTSMSVNQLRGRSIRLDPDAPEKVADNWDVVCVAGEFAKGLADYERFIDKHRTLYGVADDGAVEKGVGHVHAAFTELRPEGLEGSIGVLNAEMLARTKRRDAARALWRIGEPFEGRAVRAIESRAGGGGGFPPFESRREAWTDASLAHAIGTAILEALRETDRIGSAGRVHSAARAGGYVRSFLEGADDADAELFGRCLREALGPLDRPRYVIPRSIDVMQETWFSRLLPEVVARYLRRRKRREVMLHAVPSALDDHKDVVAIYQACWNRHVSPGEAVYAHRGRGEALVAEARAAGRSPSAPPHERSVFV